MFEEKEIRWNWIKIQKNNRLYYRIAKKEPFINKRVKGRFINKQDELIKEFIAIMDDVEEAEKPNTDDGKLKEILKVVVTMQQQNKQLAKRLDDEKLQREKMEKKQ
ncbi:MAG: hypothetical protein LBB39_00665 [Mycoplasmataceae bacterium]|nr:hypothetical protein [Mycoplasmataceae bacterium]